MLNTPLPRRFGAALAVAGSTLLLAAGGASADSIAYVKGGDVWLSTPDGARQYQVTFDGGYSTVSQADSGRIAALHGDRIRTFEPDGKIVNADGTTRYDVLTPHSYTMPGTQFRGPFDPAISPDGMKIAYTWYYTQFGETPNCNPSTGCQTVYGRQGTNYISPDGRSPFDKPGYNEQTGWVGPSWNGDGETLLSDPIQVGNPDAVVHTPGDAAGGLPGALSRWFFDPSAPGGLNDGEMTRDKTKLVFVTGEQRETLFLYRAMGGYPQVPQNCYRLEDGNGRVSSPSWSPDGKTLAFADAGGVNVLPLPDFANDCGTPTAEHTKRLLIPGASNPDWGPADVPPARPATPDRPNPPQRPNPPRRPSPPRTPTGPVAPGRPVTPAPDTAGPPRGAAITLRKRVTLGAALKNGLTVQLSGLKPGVVRASAITGAKVVASGRAKVGRSGRASVKLVFTAKARRQLRDRRSVKLRLSAGKAHGSVTLKR
ncbi:PD40 domain-containing protein [Conexibacter woesei]|uniref:WD40 domain protein beta Propeller n=1 Tax=Conexibacter woesei (strain DSM 14684 / CCUG 47730 / CIP 108061 / JCM 11494 / NBRC 100937 / ID131577) TaxID=469383 RepID=D3EYY4_CONWI|nr:PD40 domain-containing protein [Conexibacter woesei]ADB49858.1 hypothetical protein Cwoe_1430 [Conexibacter woesei DSM 14684]